MTDRTLQCMYDQIDAMAKKKHSISRTARTAYPLFLNTIAESIQTSCLESDFLKWQECDIDCDTDTKMLCLVALCHDLISEDELKPTKQSVIKDLRRILYSSPSLAAVMYYLGTKHLKFVQDTILE